MLIKIDNDTQEAIDHLEQLQSNLDAFHEIIQNIQNLTLHCIFCKEKMDGGELDSFWECFFESDGEFGEAWHVKCQQEDEERRDKIAKKERRKERIKMTSLLKGS